MPQISPSQIKELRDRTGVSMLECKKALEEAQGDMQQALAVLAARAQVAAGKKADRTLGAGIVSSYIHNQGQVGALVLLSCETDFVSKNEEFGALARDIAMHAAAMRPANVAELLEQPFIKNAEQTISALVSGAVQKFGERVEVSSLSIFSVQ